MALNFVFEVDAANGCQLQAQEEERLRRVVLPWHNCTASTHEILSKDSSVVEFDWLCEMYFRFSFS